MAILRHLVEGIELEIDTEEESETELDNEKKKHGRKIAKWTK